ncbi:MAG: hypothetical protein SFU99_08110 [Saprospiraceae bacterium]|nr:hypothetical protein [Saprospiraceae bacterium]
MVISDSKKIKDIQQEFTQKFPYLKIQFYGQPHEAGEGSSVRQQISEEKTIGSVRQIHNEGNFVIKDQMAVGEFEKAFYEKFGLSVQVFRKSGDLWMQTTSTDEWTLAEQNRKGGSSEEAFIEKYGS